MAVSTYVERYRDWRYNAFEWRNELSVPRKIALALGMACLTGLLAQVRIPLGFTPVPITGQNFAVLASGVMLGSWFGALSMVLYLAIGACGVPWFQGGEGGWQYLAHSPTLGYLFAFVVVAFFIGRLTERHVSLRGFWGQLWLMLSGMILILVIGASYLAVTLHTGFEETMRMGVLPFLAGDALKAALVAAAAAAILPKESQREDRR
ncbi:MAG: biotin transporter BioY [Dehalococcoidia bacterium]|nr:biotin transporter BioY [Dehalococcoidia bacterium]